MHNVKPNKSLINKYKYGRELTRLLVTAKGDEVRLALLLDTVNKAVEFYPEHIRKEDGRFYPDTERYYDKAEPDAMLREF